MTSTLLLLSAAMLLATPGICRYRAAERRRRADSDLRAARLLLWAKQHAAKLRRQRGGIEA
ncbi:hypothetical protein FKV24_008020 [Lysobacter maris]|uniref:Uncharacterized protein n=1 Tax=Marilutibacter maris TaxID=1605891 RepID=A0A508AVD5_9GAMM|nr:hypothetical protein [Lysobacter maris]KAB8191345.1 hypothetical protein FKV24_008020 [Lysobacter maris]